MSMDASASSGVDTKRRKSLYQEKEDIVCKPSTELIPDEYQHGSIKSIGIHVFRDADDDRHTDQSFGDAFHNANKINYYNISTVDQLQKDLNYINEDSKDKEGIIVIFIGLFEIDGRIHLLDEKNLNLKNFEIKRIWNQFLSSKCVSLRNKPKIFIFCTSKITSRIQIDGKLYKTQRFDEVYDFPAESDVLIIYKKIDSEFHELKHDFFIEFCKNIKNYGKKHDIIDLVMLTHVEKDKSLPLIISTFTRKFYFVSSAERNEYLSIAENFRNLENSLKTIHDDLKQKHEAIMKKKKEKWTLKKTFSFKKKSQSKKLTEDLHPDNSTVIADGVLMSNKSTSSQTTVRNLSESDQSKPRTSGGNKPRWKY